MKTITRRARVAGVIVAGGLATMAGTAVAFGATGGGAAGPASARPVVFGSGRPGVFGSGGQRAARAGLDASPDRAARSAPSSAPVGLVVTGTRGAAVAVSSAGRSGTAPGRPLHPALSDPSTGPRPGPARRPVAGAAALSAARLLAGVGRLPSGWVAAAHQITVAGRARVYLTVEPVHVTASLPVVVLLHGRDMSPDGILHISDLAARIGPAVLVVPAGWQEFWNAGDCCGAAYLQNINDVAFIRAALNAVVSATPTVAASPVYAVGFSNGGRMAYRLACDLPGVFTGIMAVEAVPVEACRSMHPLDVTVVAQQADPLLTVAAGGRPKTVGGFVEPTVAATVAHLGALDGCRPASVTAAGFGVAEERTWTCAAGTRLRYVWYPGGSHSWRPPTAGTPGADDFVRQLLGRAGPGGGAFEPVAVAASGATSA